MVSSSLHWRTIKGVWRVGENLLVILVVEDDHLVQSVVEESLTEGGFEIVISSSGENAVELLDSFHREISSAGH